MLPPEVDGVPGTGTVDVVTLRILSTTPPELKFVSAMYKLPKGSIVTSSGPYKGELVADVDVEGGFMVPSPASTVNAPTGVTSST
jgi:hypothetical protein